MTKVKICGLATPETVSSAIENGTDFIGLVFYEPSPRHVEINVARYLSSFIPDRIEKVGLFVNPTDKCLQEILDEIPLNVIQLHGNETPGRVNEIRDRWSIPVMKALPVSGSLDEQALRDYEAVSDWILFDARGKELPGGNGEPFDWHILENIEINKPWMLAGGITVDNVLEALQILSPDAVDVSSGVEVAKGQKDPDKIASFLKRVKSA